MFTGIVQHQGTTVALAPQSSGARLIIDATTWNVQRNLGDSIAVNGCCLTLVAPQPGAPAASATLLHFDVVPQTLNLTTLGSLQPGESVNLESAATAGSLLGGHIVQGHVDGVGRVLGIDSTGGAWRTRVQTPANVAPFMIERGSVAVDGVSLTIAALGPDWFEVALIPATLDATTLRSRLAGSRVNIEADCMARMVAEQVRRYMESHKSR
jgi:riboflavin synthase